MTAGDRDGFDGALYCAVLFAHEKSQMRSGVVFSQFLRIFLPTVTNDLPSENLHFGKSMNCYKALKRLEKA